MAMMSPKAFVAHVDHEVARKFATDILNLLEPEKPKAKPKAKVKEEQEEEKKEEK